MQFGLKHTTASDTTVVVGTNTLNKDGDVYEVEKFVGHDKYSSAQIVNDIALVKLANPIKFNEKVKAISLPKVDTPSDVEVILSGWGTTTYPGFTPNKLKTIKLKSIDMEKCQSMHSNYKLVPSQLCTLTRFGEGACHGDSGGPLIYKEEQVGVVSFGAPCARGKPDVFTRVYSYIDWINENIKE